jgi:hypothetical protein
LLLHRYHNVDYTFSLPLEDGLALINKAMEREQDKRMHQEWSAQLPLMAWSGTYESFADYKARRLGRNIDTRPTSVILAELDEVEKKFQKGGADDGA